MCAIRVFVCCFGATGIQSTSVFVDGHSDIRKGQSHVVYTMRVIDLYAVMSTCSGNNHLSA